MTQPSVHFLFLLSSFNIPLLVLLVQYIVLCYLQDIVADGSLLAVIKPLQSFWQIHFKDTGKIFSTHWKYVVCPPDIYCTVQWKFIECAAAAAAADAFRSHVSRNSLSLQNQQRERSFVNIHSSDSWRNKHTPSY